MHLIGTYLSPFTRRVAISLKILGLKFTNEKLNAWRHLGEIRKVNPAGRTPILILNNGEAIVDSMAILDYLDELVGPAAALLPQKGSERRKILKLVVVAVGAMEKGAQIRWELSERPSDKVYCPWIDHNHSQINSSLKWLNEQINYTPIDKANGINQAHISIGVLCQFLPLIDNSKFIIERYSNLYTLQNYLNSLEAFQSTSPV